MCVTHTINSIHVCLLGRMVVLRYHCVKLLNKTKRNFYGNINISKIIDNRKFWKNIKPFFSNKTISASNFILYENDEIIKNEGEVAEKFNTYFGKCISKFKY